MYIKQNMSSKKSCPNRLIYYQLFNASGTFKPCILNNISKKGNFSSDSVSARLSNNVRISQIVNYGKGGKTQYGNFYLGEPLNVNYLGRMEGMAGGSGTPPLNKFN